MVKRQKTFKAATREEAMPPAQAWMASKGGEIVYDAPVFRDAVPHSKITFLWEVIVEYDDEEVADP